MSELAASSNAPTAGVKGGNGLLAAAPVAVAAAPVAAAKANGALVTLSEDDVAKCTNCKNCYQDVPELFEKGRVVVDGQAKDVGRLIAGAVARTTPTPELVARIARVAANCDAEIIH
jgi:pyruvate-ferredoxin/flavodoxin oxidoreductase